MAELENYRRSIKRILTEYYDMKIHQGQKNPECEVSDRLAFDDIRDEYLWFRFGWEEKKLVQHIIIYLRIKDSKVWVEQDLTNFCIVDDLLAAEIPQTDIVLGFHHPSKRPFTEFATA